MLTSDVTPGGGAGSPPRSPQDTHRCALSRGSSGGTAWVRPPPPLARSDPQHPGEVARGDRALPLAGAWEPRGRRSAGDCATCPLRDSQVRRGQVTAPALRPPTCCCRRRVPFFPPWAPRSPPTLAPRAPRGPRCPAGARRAAGARTRPATAPQREAPALPGSPPRSGSIVTRRAQPANGRAAARTAD